jgi:hypothetical protein
VYRWAKSARRITTAAVPSSGRTAHPLDWTGCSLVNMQNVAECSTVPVRVLR